MNEEAVRAFIRAHQPLKLIDLVSALAKQYHVSEEQVRLILMRMFDSNELSVDPYWQVEFYRQPC